MIKRDFHTLREDINLILEIPDRIKTLDIVHLKELIIHINKRKFDLLDSINKFLMLNDNYTFEDRWLNNSQFGTNGVTLDKLEEVINKRIVEITKQPIKKLFKYNTAHNRIFPAYAYDLFSYLNNKYSEPKKPTKYSNIYHLLCDVRLAPFTQSAYEKFIRDEVIKSDKGFSKVLPGTSNYKNIRPTLIDFTNSFINVSDLQSDNIINPKYLE